MNKLTLWKLAVQLGTLDREINKFVRDVFDFDPFSYTNMYAYKPTMELAETEKEIIVTLEVPGVDVKNLDISLLGGILTVKGEKKEERLDQNKYISERYYGSFSRSEHLPAMVQEDKITAVNKDGIITITMPKVKEEVKTGVRIKVT